MFPQEPGLNWPGILTNEDYMKEKYQNWAIACQLAADQGAGNINDLRSAADFLQSLADMQEQEPDEIVPRDGGSMVTKANRDWWMSRCIDAERSRDANAQNAQEQLVSKDARIAALEQQLNTEKWESGELGRSLEHAEIEDQPKRPLLADQPEVFEALVNMIQSIAYERQLPSGLSCDSLPEYHEARKLLVGE